MKEVIKWAIIGPGAIAKEFAEGLKFVEGAELVAVASRSNERAESFGKEFGAKKAYGSYEELVEDKEIDIIYIATPHTKHKEHALLCLKAGKAVVCEKPITVNALEAKEVIDCAKASKVFFMEGMWTRFLPSMVTLRELIDKKVIGDIKQVKADFGFRADWNTEGRLLNPELAGGALLDVGVYTIAFASMIFGEVPEKIASILDLGETGVDEQVSIALKYGKGRLASLTAAIRTETLQDAYIYGTEGYIKVPDFWHADSIELKLNNMPTEIIQCSFEGNGYNYEAKEAIKCIKEGKLESDIITLEESLSIIGTMDEIRKQWDYKYPFEK